MVDSKAASAVNDGMEHLVDIVNQLQDIFGRLDNKDLALSLPQIAVVGGQSSGKSSVLENVVGKDFLPRGSGIVTRCPLILQMKNRDCSEYWQFEHLDDRIFTTALEVREEIARRTDEIAGSDKGVTNIAITLKFFSPRVLDLTLVDLPGLTRIAIEGQPADIAEQIRALVFEYVGNANVLILAITQANQDLATSDAIKVASEADPDFERTIGVLTKLDLVEEENEKTVRDVLDNKVFVLKYGFTGVINRSQKDIDEGRDIDFAYEKEKEMFKKKKWFKPIKSRLGTKYLQQVLNKQLRQHISNNMPRITADIKEHHALAKKRLLQYGDLGEDEASLMKTLVQLVDRLKLDLGQALRGAGEVRKGDQMLSKGFELRERLAKYRDTLYLIQFNEATVKHEMYISMQNMQGIEPGIFPPDKAVVGVVKHYTDEVQRISQAQGLFAAYSEKELKECVETTAQRVEQFTREDKAYIDLESEHLQTAYKKLKSGSNSLLVSSDGLYQELCSGILRGSDSKLYSCKLTPAKLTFQFYAVGSSELQAEHDVPISDYTVTYYTDDTFQLKFKKRIGGIEYLFCDKKGDTVAAENLTSWTENLKEVIASDKKKKVTAKSDKVEVANRPPAHLRGQIDAMFEIFLSLMEVAKKKYSEHIRKIICYNTIICFQEFVDTQEFYGQLVKEMAPKKMMSRSAAAKADIANLKDEVEACREALAVIETMDNS
ncbi:Dynamin-1 [Halotydeus destructor]|nr:Dynamin-1 [Halotydeus destructor]